MKETMRRAIALAAGLSAMLVTDAWGGVRVLIVGDNSRAGEVEDVRAKIVATGKVNGTFDIFNNDGGGTPTLAALNGYDVVIVWTDGGIDDAVALGNNLADYVDAGGAVIESTFGFFTTGIGIQGRWKTDNYTTMTCTSQLQGSVQTLGARLVPSHPILEGVAGFSGGPSSFRCATTLTPGSYRIADWSDGTPLIATNHSHTGKVAGLNFFPPSTSIFSGGWDAATDGGLLFANAINFATNNSVDVLICGAPGTPAWGTEVRDRILEGGRVGGRIDLFDIGAGTPSLAQLRRYDSVMVYTDFGSADADALGNNLADYVDAGGGVTVSTFAIAFGIGGRFTGGGYSPLDVGSFASGTPLTLTTRLIPGHPLLANVGTFSGGSNSYHNPATVRRGAVAVANWSNGQPLVAASTTHKGRVAALNFYPPSSVSRADFWDRATDGAALIGNALTWTARNDNDVLILGDDILTGSMDDIRSKIRANVDGTIDTYDYTGPIPSIAALRRYDSIMVFANLPASDVNVLGDRLADFVDGGGGVVDMFATSSSGWAIGGRWAGAGYSGMIPGNRGFGTTLTLGAKLYPLHPVLDNVAAVNLGAGSFHNDGAVRPGSLRLADLSNGRPLAVERSTGNGRVVTLNFFPVSADRQSDLWVVGTDVGRLMANSVNHVARSDIEALIVGTEDVGSGNSVDLRRKIQATGRIRGRIDAFDSRGGNPPPGLLAAYDSTLAWANFAQSDGAAMGNLLAIYANNGGGVVTASGAHANSTYGIMGAWLARPYTPFGFNSGALFSPGVSIAARQHPEHPVLAGVDAFDLGPSGLHDATTTSSIGDRIANLSNGRPLAAEAKVPGARQAIALNMFPVSTDGNGNGWNAATKGGLLMANALTYVSKERPCLVDFNGDGFIDFFDYDDYVNCFESGICPPGRDADINGDGFVDFFDYDAFVAAFETGC